MSNLNDLINLAKADGGKFFVIDEEGNAKLVIMSIDDYQRLLLGKLQRQITDVEKINKEILEAQLTEDPIVPPVASAPFHRAVEKGPTVSNQFVESKNDLRAEVIDPSFDFEGPKVEIDDL
jgi:hypothetical protein